MLEGPKDWSGDWGKRSVIRMQRISKQRPSSSYWSNQSLFQVNVLCIQLSTSGSRVRLLVGRLVDPLLDPSNYRHNFRAGSYIVVFISENLLCSKSRTCYLPKVLLPGHGFWSWWEKRSCRCMSRRRRRSPSRHGARPTRVDATGSRTI